MHVDDAAWAQTEAVIDYDRPPPTFGKTGKFTVIQRGSLTRIDGPGASQFSRVGQAVTLSVRKDSAGRLLGLYLMDDPVTAVPPAVDREFSGEVEHHLGESCRVWRKAWPSRGGFEFVQSGCVTDDGIELWRRQANIDATFATRVSRQPVSVEEVSAPLAAFDLASWVNPDRAADHRNDYELVLEGLEDGQGRRMVYRRSGGWTSIAETGPVALGYTTLYVESSSEALSMRYSSNRNGERQFTIERWGEGRRPGSALGYRGEPVDRAPETVLGERCEWRDMMPNVSDAGRHDCLTADGRPLKIILYMRGHPIPLAAVRMDRARQPLSSVLPDAGILSAAAWGF